MPVLRSLILIIGVQCVQIACPDVKSTGTPGFRRRLISRVGCEETLSGHFYMGVTQAALSPQYMVKDNRNDASVYRKLVRAAYLVL